MNGVDKLVMMTNQIARSLQARGEEEAVAETASHIAKFWNPAMRESVDEYIQQNGDDLSPVALKACKIACSQTIKPQS